MRSLQHLGPARSHTPGRGCSGYVTLPLMPPLPKVTPASGSRLPLRTHRAAQVWAAVWMPNLAGHLPPQVAMRDDETTDAEHLWHLPYTRYKQPLSCFLHALVPHLILQEPFPPNSGSLSISKPPICADSAHNPPGIWDSSTLGNPNPMWQFLASWGLPLCLQPHHAGADSCLLTHQCASHTCGRRRRRSRTWRWRCTGDSPTVPGPPAPGASKSQ